MMLYLQLAENLVHVCLVAGRIVELERESVCV